MSRLDEIAARDAEAGPDASGHLLFGRQMAADRRYLLGLVREAREALLAIVDLPTVVPDHPHGGIHPPYLEWRRVAEVARAAAARLTEGSDRT